MSKLVGGEDSVTMGRIFGIAHRNGIIDGGEDPLVIQDEPSACRPWRKPHPNAAANATTVSIWIRVTSSLKFAYQVTQTKIYIVQSILPSFFSRLASCFLVGMHVVTVAASPLPDVESDGRLGSWADFLNSMGYSERNGSANLTVYLDTDRLSAGVITIDGSLANGGWRDLDHQRTELRQNVGRLVAQINGPDIVVYDFTEIITSVPGELFSTDLVIIGQRPAAIVCQGMIGGHAPSESLPEDLFLGAYLDITALNSCDPDNPLESRWLGTSPGSRGLTASYTDNWGVTETKTGFGGSGGYGGSGVSGQGATVGGLTASGGNGGSATFAWNVLQAGSPGGMGGGGSRDGASPSGNPYSRPDGRGGQGGGAILLKAEGPIAVREIFARGAAGESGGGSGSGGHVIIDTRGTVRLGSVDISGGNNGGGGVLEFRKSPRIIGIGSSSTKVSSGLIITSELNLGIVGLPSGVSFPSSGSVFSTSIYRTSYRPDSAAPLISIQGTRTRNVAEGSTWTDEGATAVDNVDGSVVVNPVGSVNTAIPGAYEITYLASDAAGNSASKKRYVNVVPNQPAERDLQSGLPQLVAATLRPVNPTTGAVDAKLLPTFSFVTVSGQTYPSVNFLRRTQDFLPIGSYPETSLDKDYRMEGKGLSYSFRTSADLGFWAFQSLFDFTFVTRSNTRNGIAAPAGFEFATYRYNSATASSPPHFYRVSVTANPLNN